MMISPETYYEECLQGKSQSVILQQISLLKKEIDRLKEVMESDENSPESMVMPSPLTRIKCNREYLEMAKLALEETGGQYELTDEEFRKIEEAIPYTAQGKTAGNSIVVNVLFHIFRKLFIDNDLPDKGQQYTLF